MTDDPYEVLELPADASEEMIRQRYLELVRQFPPDRAPERFTAIRSAYEALHDPVRRLRTELFNLKRFDSLDQILADVRRRSFDPRQISLRKVLERAERL